MAAPMEVNGKTTGRWNRAAHPGASSALGRASLPDGALDLRLIAGIRARLRPGQPPDRRAEALFGRLYARHQARCAGRVRARMGPEDAADVLSEAWIAVWADIQGRKPIEHFAAYLDRLVAHKIADACEARTGIRRLNRDRSAEEVRRLRITDPDALRRLQFEPLPDSEDQLPPSTAADPLDEALRQERGQRLGDCLACLREPWRLAIHYRLGEQLSVQDTAERMGASEGAVKKYVERGLKALRRLMDEDRDYWSQG